MNIYNGIFSSFLTHTPAEGTVLAKPEAPARECCRIGQDGWTDGWAGREALLGGCRMDGGRDEGYQGKQDSTAPHCHLRPCGELSSRSGR